MCRDVEAGEEPREEATEVIMNVEDAAALADDAEALAEENMEDDEDEMDGGEESEPGEEDMSEPMSGMDGAMTQPISVVVVDRFEPEEDMSEPMAGGDDMPEPGEDMPEPMAGEDDMPEPGEDMPEAMAEMEAMSERAPVEEVAAAMSEASVPSDIPGIRAILQEAKLQAPTSDDEERELIGFESEFFFVVDGVYARFVTDNERSELRCPIEDAGFVVQDATERLDATLRLPGDIADGDNYTWMQVHSPCLPLPSLPRLGDLDHVHDVLCCIVPRHQFHQCILGR